MATQDSCDRTDTHEPHETVATYWDSTEGDWVTGTISCVGLSVEDTDRDR